ncbi:MAG TPA: hypothetical protein VHX86_01825 [Tepidisphaeraceae bacterium]|jgi:hypothetical protein|nr:hypothetical protein [Tepidisphaeraceae bacterium]
MGEAQYLHEQSERAKAAMWAALRELKQDAGQAADPREWAKTHPWMTVAAAAAAGFAVATTIGKPAPAESDHAEQPHDSATRRFLAMAEKVISLTKPLLTAILMAHTAKSHLDGDADGHPQPEPLAM